MQQFNSSHYSDILNDKINFGSETIQLIDHLTGFDPSRQNVILDYLSNQNIKNDIETMYIFDNLNDKYVNLNLKFSPYLQNRYNLQHFKDYQNHPTIKIKNFLCSFNGGVHVSRKFLTAVLHKFGYFNSDYCSKNHIYTLEELDGHILDYNEIDDRFYRKFFIFDDCEKFFQKIYSFGHVRYDHKNNIYNLENKLTESFVHLVSETMGTSCYPFVTEKFLYSIVTRGLFLSYAQPGWHKQIEKYYGFKLYTKLFDYSFDLIDNPVKRLVELITMISKFSKLSYDDLYDIYLIELDTINYNYDHYFSGRYLEHLKQYGTNI